MTVPTGFPLPQSSGKRSLRFYVADTATADWANKAYIFAAQPGASNTTATPVVLPGSNATVNFPANPTGSEAWSGSIRICNDATSGGASLEFTFDGTNVHGKLVAGESVVYWGRWEAGIAVRGATAPFRIEAW